MKRPIVLILVFVLLGSQSFAFNCRDEMSTLSPEATMALKKYGQHSDVQILHKKINGLERTVALMGEDHLKGEQANQLGRQVLEHFDYRGLEGAPIMQTWGGKVFSITVDLFYKALSKIMSVDRESSSILSAREDDENGAVNFDLESDTPKLGLNIASVAFPACISGICTFALTLLVPSAYDIDKFRAYTIAIVAVTLPVSLAGFLSRNSGMAANIEKAFAEKPDARNILVIVGEFHNKGIMKILKKKYGYREGSF